MPLTHTIRYLKTAFVQSEGSFFGKDAVTLDLKNQRVRKTSRTIETVLAERLTKVRKGCSCQMQVVYVNDIG
jgi:uncharacterized protein YheU (UPF0270 family)